MATLNRGNIRACAWFGQRYARFLVTNVLCASLVLFASAVTAQEKAAATVKDLKSVAADRLSITPFELTKRGEELKRLHTVSFERDFQGGEKHIAHLARRLADYERRANALARGVPADGDKDLADSKNRMQQDLWQIRGIVRCFNDSGARLLAYHSVVANVVGALSARPSEEPEGKDVGSSRVDVDVDAHGLEASIPRLQKWRLDLIGRCRAIEGRLQPMKERLRVPQSEFKKDNSSDSTLLTKALLTEALQDVAFTEQQFDDLLQEYAGRTASNIRDFQVQAADLMREWNGQYENSVQTYVVHQLTTELAAAKKIKTEKTRDTAIDAIKSKARRATDRLDEFDRTVKRAEAIELEATVVLLLREARNDIVASFEDKPAPNAKESGKPAIDIDKTPLPELIAVTIPRIQEINQAARRQREMWLR